MRASLAAAAVLLAVLASSAVGVGADHPRTVSRTPRFKTFARPSRAKAWVPEAHVFANKTRDTDVLDGVLAVDGTYALVVSNDQLPSLAPISSTFTIAMSLFLHDDLNVASIDAHRGIFWKGGASGDRTPSAWLIPHSNRVTYRVSTSSAEEVWGTSAAALPTRRWVHLAFSVGADRIMRLYVDGKLDSAVEIVGEVVANDGPLYLGKDAHLTGINAFIASVQMHAHALEDEDIAQAAAHALRAAPDFDGEASAEARAGADANREARERHHRDGDAFASLLSSLPMPMHARQAAAMTSSARAEMEVRTSQARADAIANAEEKEKMARRMFIDAEYSRGGIALNDAMKSENRNAGGTYRYRRGPRESGLAKAREHYLRAAAMGHDKARYALATMHQLGYGGPISHGKALYHKLRAAARGDPGSNLAVGSAAFAAASAAASAGGGGGEAACRVAEYYLLHAANVAYDNSGKPGGQNRVERLRLYEGVEKERQDHKGPNDQKVQYLVQTASHGDALASLAMGNAYYWGNFGLRRNFQAALFYYESAHAQGALHGTVGVAKMNLKGEGLAGGVKNVSRAMEMYEQAAKRDSPDALNGLGYIYFYGDADIEKNTTTALSYFRKAAALGNADGHMNSGLMLRAGIGERANLTEAHEHFSVCAKARHTSCIYQIGLMHSEGSIPGAERDCFAAAQRFRRVAQSGEWMEPLSDGLKAHLAGNASLARWTYDYVAGFGMPVARYNAAWLHTIHAREIRVALESPARDSGRLSDESDLEAIASGRRSAGLLSYYASEMTKDPATTLTDRAYAAMLQADCLYHGEESRPGARCARRLPDALAAYERAGRIARVAARTSPNRNGDDGESGELRDGDARLLLARALYSEAWMRARGEGCAVDRTRAKAALWSALAEGRWQSSLAVAPSFAWFVAEDAFRYLVPSRGRGRDGAAAADPDAIARASASVTSGSGLASRLARRAAAPWRLTARVVAAVMATSSGLFDRFEPVLASWWATPPVWLIVGAYALGWYVVYRCVMAGYGGEYNPLVLHRRRLALAREDRWRARLFGGTRARTVEERQQRNDLIRNLHALHDLQEEAARTSTPGEMERIRDERLPDIARIIRGEEDEDDGGFGRTFGTLMMEILGIDAARLEPANRPATDAEVEVSVTEVVETLVGELVAEMEGGGDGASAE